jgi:Fe-S cluster assembly protein SufD
LYLADSNQHVDNQLFVDHAAPNCWSNQQYKGILDDEATAVFSGKIMVQRDAQKTLAYQNNKNILLTDEAKANAQPQLEIYADDVKCSHGATVGQLDPEAMFYLRSRGLCENSPPDAYACLCRRNHVIKFPLNRSGKELTTW